MQEKNQRSTIALKVSTKKRLDRSRAPGQCYDGFLCQLVDMWDKTHSSSLKTEITG
jgi:hypothetical protein